MYFDYDKFIEMLIESEYIKVQSDLVREYWTNDIVVVMIRHVNYKVIDDIKIRGCE